MESSRTVDTSKCLVCCSPDREVAFPATGPLAEAHSRDFVCTNASHGEHGEIVRCLRCGFVFADPQPTSEELTALYAGTTDPIYAEEKRYRLANFRDLFDRHLDAVPTSGRLLDVGCHIGAFLEVARERGLETWGVEPSVWAVERARAAGFDVVAGTLDNHQPELPPDFDVITIWDVLEHFANPRRELELAHDRLAPGGILALTTMDVSSRFARMLGRRWPWLMRMHLFYFNRSTLAQTLEETGFEVLSIESCRRIVSLGYLLKKLETYTRPVARAAAGVATSTGAAAWSVPVNFGDIMIAVARRKR